VPTLQFVSYRDFQQALVADRTSALDRQAAAIIAKNNSIALVINRTSDSPEGVGSSTPYLDANNSLNNQTVALTQANARALGLYSAQGGGSDASISISSGYNWDFDPSDGISAGTADFVGAATHEIGHALGFDSGTQLLEFTAMFDPGALGEDDLPYVTSLDQFRYSSLSRSYGAGVIDWSADTRENFFRSMAATRRSPSFRPASFLAMVRKRVIGRMVLGWASWIRPSVRVKSPGSPRSTSRHATRLAMIAEWHQCQIPA